MTNQLGRFTTSIGNMVKMLSAPLIAFFLLSSQPANADPYAWSSHPVYESAACGTFPFWTDALVECSLQALWDNYPAPEELAACTVESWVDPHPPIDTGDNVYRRELGWRIFAGGTWVHSNGITYPCASTAPPDLGYFEFGREWTRGKSCQLVGYTYSVAVGGCVPPAPADVTERDDANGKICKGNPCDILSGNKRQQEVDYSGAGELAFARTYNSLRFHSAKQGPYGKPLGEGWFAPYFQYLSAASGLSSSTVHAVRPDGEVVSFTATAPGSTATQYSATGEIKERLVVAMNTSGAFVGWLYVTESDSSELYDANGRLVSITSRSGQAQTLTYGSNSRVDSVVDDFGNELTFQWDTSSPPRLASITLPGAGSGQVVFTYGANNNLIQVTYPDTRTRQYLYELAGAGQTNLLTGIIDEAGARFATWGYGSGNVVTSSSHAGGVESYTITYNADGTRVVVDPLGTSFTYGTSVVAGQRRNTSASPLCQGCGEHAASTYDALGNFQSTSDFDGVETRYTYDTSRTLETSRTEAYGTPRSRTISTAWHPTYRLPTLVSEPGRTTVLDYDSSGNLLERKVTDTASSETRTWTYTYDTYGRRLTEDGPRTDVSDLTTYTYYTCGTGFECGHLNTVTNPLGQITSYTSYNAHGQPLSITDPNGVVTTLTYDERQRLRDSTVAGELTAVDYWPTGLLRRVTLPDSSFVEYSYDAAHRLVRVDDANGNHVVYTLDGMGNRTGESTYDPANALRRTRSRVFNNLNQLWKGLTAAGTLVQTTEFGYDINGNQTTTSAPVGRSSGKIYDELHRVISTSDPESGITQFGYDARDNVSSVTDPRNHVTSYAYNGFDEPLEQTSPDTGLTTNTYDAAGNVVTSTDARGALSGYTYDALNRLTSAVYSRDGVLDQTVTYTYDAGAFGKGRRTGASDEDHSMQWVYDERGRVTSKTQTVSGVASTVSYAYTNGNLATIVTPSGQTIQYGYNTNGQVTSVTVNGTTVLSGVTYDPFGPVNGWTWGNGTIASRTFDTDGNVTAVSSGGRQRTYSHDDAFRITGVADPMTPSNSYAYGYDGLDRLTSAATSTTTRGWTYDATGNRLSETGDSPSSYTISGARNRVTSISGAVSRSYTYNAVGSVRTYEDATVTYSDHGRMRRFTRGTTTARFVYNALDQRVKRSGDGTGAVLYMYDEAGHLLGEYHGSGGLIQETVWLGDIPVATLRPGTPTRVFYVHTDHLNTPRKVTRPSDNKARWTWESDPFGVSLPNESPEGLAEFEYNLRFPGQIYDAHTKLMYNYFRDYDPVAGRYIQSDPIGLGGGINPYLYVGANPLSNVDPRGLEIYIPEGSANCWVNMLFDNRNNPRDTGRTQEQEEGVYRKERFVFPVIAPSVSIEPQEPKGRLEPVSVGFIVFWGLYRDTWLHRVYERSVTYDFICQDPCTGKIDATRGQGHDEVLGPPETFVRRNLIDTDVEFIPSQFPISPPSPVPRRGR